MTSSAEKTFVIGSSTPLSSALSKFRKDVVFFGRTNPHKLSQWEKIPGQETKAGIDKAISALNETLSLITLKDEAHLVCLQGLSDKNWEASINVNLLSVALITDSFCSFLEERNVRGSITLIASASSYLGGKETYASTKAALFGLMNSLQGKRKQVRINLILPGAFEGGMTADWDAEKKGNIGRQANAGRLATSEEIAHAINFCMENKYISQSVINMTSGRVTIA